MTKISIVYQTHWDREWYLDLDTTNIRLKKIVQRVIELLQNEEIMYFVFDGQVKAIEDYLSICEDEERDQLLFYIKNGRIIIGPWYVLSDEFLVSGESLVRNLEMGIEKSKELSNYQKVGYLPDTFGHISQMPQILKNFHIDNAILWRGVLPNDTFFQWEGANDDKVFAVFLKEGYYQPIVDQPNYKTLMKTYLDKYSSFSNYNNILLTNGGDHLAPARGNIHNNIKELEQEYNIEIDNTYYEKYIESVQNKEQFELIKGELRDNTNCYVLPNVLSTRYYLKKQNQEAEDKIKILESLIAKRHINTPYENNRIISQIWEQILLNHPHDSICGCSIDKVHKEMEIRTQKNMSLMNALIKDEFMKMGNYPNTLHYNTSETKVFDDYTRFTIYNPTVRRVNGFKTIKVFVNKENPLVDNFIVTDGVIDYTTIIVDKKETRIFESPIDYFPEFRSGYEYELVFRVKDLRGLSNNNYYLKKGTPVVLESINKNVIENDKLKVTVNLDGTLSVLDKEHNKVHSSINKYVSSLDRGDEYNYSKPGNDIFTEATLLHVSQKASDYYQEMILEHELVIPEKLNSTLKEVSPNYVTNIITTKIRLYHEENTLYFDTTYTNKAQNQRTRVLFDLNEQINNHYSDTAFDIVSRSVRSEIFKAAKQQEVPVVVDPSLSMITTDSGLRFDHVGMQEYQIIREKNDVLAVTMLRGVGSISRDDLESRGGGAGPSMKTPDAQMIGTYSYKYSVSFNDVPTYTNNDAFRLGLLVTKGHVERKESFIQIDNPNIYVSSIRKKDSVELRIFNPTFKDEQYELHSMYPITSITSVDFLGNIKKNQTNTVLNSKEIKTVQIGFSETGLIHCDALITGGSIGGVRAAVKLLEKGKKVVLTEETDWIGGQLTSQAVPLDEHPFIEEFGCPASYREFREKARKYYIHKYNVLDTQKLNPGSAWVSRLSFEPKVALQLFNDMLEPYIGKNLTIMYNTKPIKSNVIDGQIKEVTVENINSYTQTKIIAPFYIDATDLGDLLPITNTEYVTGAEGKEITKELHANKADKEDMQPVTHVLAMKWNKHNKNLIDRPKQYDYFKSLKTTFSEQKVLSEYGPDSTTGKERKFNIYDGKMPLWTYRRYFNPVLLQSADFEKTTINWPQNDYFLGNIFDDEFDDYHKEMAKELTKSFVYYLQNEVPRHDGGCGYPEMEVCNDLGTDDGLAKYPYIREGRRIKALYTIKEEDISGRANKKLPHTKYSVGVGSYHIDLHITTKSNEFFYDNTWPFEIPLGAFISINTANIIPACKNIGTTHLTNGSFRLHPVEWNIGEVAGLLCNYLINNNISLTELYQNETEIKNFQTLLVEEGIELHWPENKVKII